MRRRIRELLSPLPEEEPGGWPWVAGAMGLLWLTFMAITWLAPNECTVPMRLGVTAWLSLLCGSFAAAAMRKEREVLRERRQKNGLCPRCGYDLRATAGWCPECGTVPDQ